MALVEQDCKTAQVDTSFGITKADPTQHDNASIEEGAVHATSTVLADGGYGWVCVAAVFLINAHSWGINTVNIPFLTVSDLTDSSSATVCS